MNNAYISEYLQQVKAQLPVYGKAEQAFLMQLTDTIDSYFSEAQIVPESVSDVVGAFGTPQHIVDEHYSEDVHDVVRYIRARRYVRICLAAVLAALVFVLTTFIVSQVYWSRAEQNMNVNRTLSYSYEKDSAESEFTLSRYDFVSQLC